MEIQFTPAKKFVAEFEDLEIVFVTKGDPGVRNSSDTRRDARRDRKRTLKARRRAKLRG